METVSKQVVVPKEAAAIGDALVAIAKAIKIAKADGIQLGSDVPAVLAASFGPLVKAFEGLHDLPAEMGGDVAGVIKALVLAGADIFAELKG